jgi:hypothetical protein
VHVPEIELDIPIIVISVEACSECERHAVAAAKAAGGALATPPELFTMLTATCEHWNRSNTPRFLYQHPKPKQFQVLAREQISVRQWAAWQRNQQCSDRRRARRNASRRRAARRRAAARRKEQCANAAAQQVDSVKSPMLD